VTGFLLISTLATAGTIRNAEEVEVLALNVDRGVAALKVRIKGTYSCGYRGMDDHPTSGTALIIWELSGETPVHRSDIYPAATKASSCIPHAESVIRLKRMGDLFETWGFDLADKPVPVNVTGTAFRAGWIQGPYTIYTMVSTSYTLSPAYVDIDGMRIGTDPNPVRPPDAPPPFSIAEFNRQIAAAEPGETIRLTRGRYDVDVDLGLRIEGRKNLTILGDGDVLLFSQRPDSTIVTIRGSSGIVLDGFSIVHEANGVTASSVVIADSSDIDIRRNDIHGGAVCISATGMNNTDIDVIDNMVHDCSEWGIHVQSTGGEVTRNALYENKQDLRIADGVKVDANDISAATGR
jgi:hypothetical protein